MQLNPRKYFRIFLLAGLVNLAAASAIDANTAELPDLGSPDLVLYDRSTEEKLGRAFVVSLHKGYNLFEDRDTNQYIRDLGHRIAGHTGTNRNFTFYVIDDLSINAFAGPNGVIGIHTGLIQAVRTEDELAAVIAHEISHVTQNHLSRRFDYANNHGNLNSLATIIAAVLIGMQNPDAGMATMMGGMGLNIQNQLKNSRIHEKEADSIGIKLLHQAGFDPHAMGDFFGRLSKASSINSFQTPEILRTHPISEKRLAEAENRARQLNKKEITKNSVEFALIKIKTAKNYETKVEMDRPLSKNERCYLLSHSETAKQTSKCLRQLAFEDNTTPIFFLEYLSKIEELTKHQRNRINKRAHFLLELFPQNQSLLIGYANYLAEYETNLEAISILEQQQDMLLYQSNTHKRLSELYSKRKQSAHAYFYLAKANIEIGNLARAKHYLEQSKKAKYKADKRLSAKIASFEQKHRNLLIKKENNK